MVWNTETFRPSKGNMDATIKILKNTIIDNEPARVGEVYTLPAHIASMHVSAGNAEYSEDQPTNRAVGVKNSDSTAKKRKK
jgi:hypothetical protein